VVDGTLQVSDALFQGNQAGWVGGAIYAIGTTTAIPATPHTSVAVTRSTFQANAIAPQPCCPPPGPPTGGAIHVENQALLSVTGSRFVDNQAQFGGAIDGLGAVVDVAGSTFQGNGGAVTGSSEAVGGAICVLAGGAPAGGGSSPPAGLTVSGSLLQGSHAGSGPVGNAGGCVLVIGDQQDLYGLGGHAPHGTLDSDRLAVQISGTVFDACDVQQSPTAGGGQGGAINGALVALTKPRIIELLLVVLVIGILAAIAVPSFLSSKGKALDVQAKELVRTAQTTAETIAASNSAEHPKIMSTSALKLSAAVDRDRMSSIVRTRATGRPPLASRSSF